MCEDHVYDMFCEVNVSYSMQRNTQYKGHFDFLTFTTLLQHHGHSLVRSINNCRDNTDLTIIIIMIIIYVHVCVCYIVYTTYTPYQSYIISIIEAQS